MDVLVTGATGFLGRHLVPRLLADGHRVRALVRDARLARRRLPPDIDIHLGDLTRHDSLEGLVDGVDAVIHLAAATAGDWATQRAVTVEGAVALLHRCHAAHVRRFVHVSSVAVYDPAALADGALLAADAPLAEPDAELGAYARAKVQAERMARDAAGCTDMQLTVVRPGLVYGPGHVLFEHLGKPLGPLPCRLAYGSPRQRLPFVHVDSVADALARVIQRPETIGRTYNIVDESDCTRAAYLKRYEQITGRRVRTWYLPAAPVAAACDVARRLPPLAALSGSKIRTRALSLRYRTDDLARDAGWSPMNGWPEALAAAVRATPGPNGRRLRVAVIGAGMNAGYHLRPLRSHEHVEVVGLMDQQRDRAEALAGEHGVGFATDNLDELFDRARPEAVHVVTPPQSHAAVVTECLRRGADVLCEKPMAMTVDECREMRRVADEQGRSLAINHNMLFDPRIAAARRLLASGVLGELVHVEAMRVFAPRGLSGQPDARAAWVRALPGGLLEDVAPHPLCITLAMLGRHVELVDHRAWSTGRLDEADDEMRLSLSDGVATGHVTVSLSGRPDTFTVLLCGTRASVLVDVQNMLTHVLREGRGPRAAARALQLGRISLGNATQTAANAWRLATGRAAGPGDMTPIIREHVACLLDDRPFAVGAEAGEQVVSVVERVWPRGKPAPRVPVQATPSPV